MTHPFKAVSLTYKKAPVAIRELLALNEAACGQLLNVLQHELFLTDVLVLSTCNRTEVYYSAEDEESTAILGALAQVTGVADAARYSAYFTVLNSAPAAVQHLFEVALGLDAQVVGDMQISNQVKKAYQRSAEAQAAGPFLHRLLHTVLAANKRVQQETSFRDGAASTSYATLELVQELTADVPLPRVLIVGLGEIGADICRHFAKSKHFAEVTVCNRTASTALAISAECGLQVLDFADLATGLEAADVVISSLNMPTPFFTHELVSGLAILSPKFFIDLSVPRSIEEAAESVPGVLVYNIDAIQSKASEALARRMAAVPQVRAIIAESLDTLASWSRDLRVSPAIQQLKNSLEQMRQQELGRFGKNISGEESRRLDDATKALTQKFLKLPVLQLKAACQRGEADQLVAVLTELFALEG
ncbi:glutamyl-tRNA reductase [Hymenobacter sp. BT770]|uniref:glutamyl-tRNA reductase n=1 Tax=Hymenobacter sp. BT770 TaxID=2886942 RepID=UPI001D11598F|nr:glutamyl-tRNA reductase [Hymenobacter sp. BT770]MCC3155336.1 glutamyl-tRNA reductase [Hymenobacter sp. BT770]MDO3417369.1 glutamyl-tRNA reductase [Hymenobacter sp. BT770]